MLDVILAVYLNFATSNSLPHDNAMTDVHGYDIHSVPFFTIVFHYSVGFDIAYPRKEAMRRPKYTG